MFVAANLSRVPVASRSPTQLRRQKHACVASRTVAHGCMRTTLPTQTAKSTQRIAQHSQGPERSRSRAVYMITSAAAAGSAQDAAKVQPYRFVAYVLIAASLIPMVNPTLIVGVSAAPAVEAVARAAGACQIQGAFSALALAAAAEHGRLTSDTYRRLNFSLILQAALLGAAAVQGTALPAAVCQTTFAAAAAICAVCGWGYLTTAGVSAAQASGAILAGTAEAPGAVLKGLAAGGFAFVYALLIVSNLPLARARRLSAHVMLFILLAAQQYAPLVIAAGGDAIAVACARLCGAGLAGALGTLYVHIDAALRGRLSASTFRLLNWASLLNAVTLSAICIKLALTGGIAEAHKAMIGGIGALFLSVGLFSVFILQSTQKKKAM